MENFCKSHNVQQTTFWYHCWVLNHQPLDYKATTLENVPHCTDTQKELLCDSIWHNISFWTQQPKTHYLTVFIDEESWQNLVFSLLCNICPKVQYTHLFLQLSVRIFSIYCNILVSFSECGSRDAVQNKITWQNGNV